MRYKFILVELGCSFFDAGKKASFAAKAKIFNEMAKESSTD